jgi:hypothetical protein
MGWWKDLRRRLRPPLDVSRLVERGLRPARGTPTDAPWLAGRYGYDDEDAIKEAIARVAPHTMCSFERLATLWQQVRYLDRFAIPGSLVECGTWRGGCVGMMALAHLAKGPPATRDVHLFDSFEGLPEPDAALDGQSAVEYAGDRGSGALAPIGECVATLEENRALVEGAIGYPKALLHYHVGWFEERVPRDAEATAPIALLRLDGDWYQSTRVCLEHLYPRVVRGGVVVIDDYGRWAGARRAVDEYVARLREPVLLQHVDGTGRAFVRVGPP